MARSDNNLKAVLEDTAEAIRNKKGTSDPIIPRDFADEIDSIPVAGDDNFYDYLIDNYCYKIPDEIGRKCELRSGAFSYANLKEIDLKNANIIPSNCFYYCRTIQTIKHSNPFYFFGSSAFYYCEQLKNIPDLVKDAFSVSQSAFTYAGKSQTSFSLNFDIVYLDNAFGGTLVNKVKGNCINMYYAFVGCSLLSDIDIGYGILGQSCLEYCSGLEKITLKGPTNIGQTAFQSNVMLSEINGQHLFTSATGVAQFESCYRISKLSMPNFCGSITSRMFADCNLLNEILTGALTSLNTDAFKNCSNLESIYILGNHYSNGYIMASLQNSNIFNGTPIADSSYLGRFGSIYVPPSWVASYKSATNWAFFSDRITAIPSEFDSKFIYPNEFRRQSNVSYPFSRLSIIENICSTAFEYFNPSESENIINMPNCKYIGCSAFTNNGKITTISLPECEVIDNYAFSGCANLREIYAPKLKYIGYGVFQASPNLNNLDFPECVIVKQNAFMNVKVSSLNLPKCKVFETQINSGNISYLNLPECISTYYLSLNNNISSINIPKAKIVNFPEASGLSIINLPNCIIFNGLTNGNNLEEIYLDNVLYFSGMRNCQKLINVSMPKCLSLFASAFSYCTKLEKLNLPKVENMGTNCIVSCNALKKILLPNLNSITGASFIRNCNSLESLYLFRKNIVNFSPAYSSYISTALENTPMVNSSYLGYFGSIYVPSALLSYYQENFQWSQFSERFVGLTDEEMQNVIDHFDD